MKRFLMVLILVGISCGLVFGMGHIEPRTDMAGKQAIEFTLETTANKSLTLTQARDGKKAILIFWATWCPHCREELEVLRQKADAIKKRGVQIVLVDVGETKEEASSYLKHQQIPFESFIDEDNTVAGQYGLIGVPTLVYIDEKGIIRNIDHELSDNYLTEFDSK
jgi:peroxiredoxin